MRLTMMVAIALLLAAGCGAEVPVENADFSAGGNGQAPPGWDASQARDTLLRDDADGHEAPGCLRYFAEADGPRCYVTQAVAVEAQTDYVLSASIKFAGELAPVVGVREPGEQRTLDRIGGEHGTGWQAHQLRFNTGRLTEIEIIIFGDYGPGEKSRAGEARFDDIGLARAGEMPAGAWVPGGNASAPPGENIALGKSYAWSQKPGYSLSNDDADITQLTDGEFTSGYFWVQKTTVGWQMRKPLSITIDLEQPEPICGVSFRTAAGTAGVGWPAMIFVLTSMDGEQFTCHGELISLSGEWGLPDPQQYSVHRFYTGRLRAAGRYLKLVACPGSKCIFADEIEVYRGEFAIADAEPGEPVIDDASLVAERRVQGIVGVRLLHDVRDVRVILNAAQITAAKRIELADRLAALEQEALTAQFGPVDHWRGLPYNDLHARIWALTSAIRRAEGHPELIVWQSPRWDMLDPLDLPGEPGAVINVPVMNGEYRSAAFNLTSYTDRARNARLWVEFADGTDPGMITIHEVQYVQTQERRIVANALPVADIGDDGRAIMSLPAGITRQVWLTVHPEGVAPGRHVGWVRIEVSGKELSLPLSVDVAPMDFPEPPLSLFCWDYVGDRIAYALEFTDPDRMAANLQAHFVDAPWLHPGSMAWPDPGDVDAAGHITKPMDFGPIDRWIARFPGARLYSFCMSGHTLRNPLTVGSDRWKTAIGEWATAYVEHLRGLGVEPERWCLLIIDEPYNHEQEQRIIDVANALRAAEPEIQVFEDPTRGDPTEALPGLYEVSDILCPVLPRVMPPYEKAREFYTDLLEQGKRLAVYQCAGPHKLLDPFWYHRLEAWHAWNLGATGIGFWGYVDHQGTGSSWDNFKCGGTSYSLVYADDVHLADSKQWEAVREGVEDYTYLAMLREAVAAHEGEDTEAVRHARELLETLPAQVAGTWDAGAYRWVDRRDRSVADTAREQILKALIALQ